ncbi:MAG: holo-ACP synthase [Clostridia bacterium]|nr:holo-ACP synthase [Clostridia bacterium]
MNLKTGIDIIEVNRIQENIEKYGEKFLNRIYTNNEINYCESKKTQKFQSYAGRFAAKEAVFKALSEFLDNKFEIEWKDIEVINDKNGRPSVNFYGILTEIITLKNNIDVSISHIKDIAIASAIIKWDN